MTESDARRLLRGLIRTPKDVAKDFGITPGIPESDDLGTQTDDRQGAGEIGIEKASASGNCESAYSRAEARVIVVSE